MKAVLQTKYGSPQVLKFVEVDKPFPEQDQVHAVGLNMADWRLLAGSPSIIRLVGLGKGKVPGSDMAGCVLSIGQELQGSRDVRQIQPGQKVVITIAGKSS